MEIEAVSAGEKKGIKQFYGHLTSQRGQEIKLSYMPDEWYVL